MAGAEARHAAFTSGSWFKDHDVILNTLERENKGMYLALEAFEGTVADWDGVPVIFATKHPNMDVFEEDAALAVAQVEGRFVGNVRGPHIDPTGHPTLNSTLALEDDPTLEGLIAQGKLSLSTGFWHGGLKADPNLPVPVVQGPVRPQHVLLFPEDATTNDVPGDKGAFILNGPTNEEDNNLTENAEALGLLDKARAMFARAKPEPAVLQDEEGEGGDTAAAPEATAPIAEVVDAAADAVQGVVEATITYDPEKLAADLATAMATIAQLQARIKEMEGAATTEAELKAEKQWTEMKEQLPDGLTHGEGKEAKLRAQWDEDPHGFTLMALKLKTDPELPGQEGAEFTDGEGGETAGVSAGWPDPDTGEWKI